MYCHLLLVVPLDRVCIGVHVYTIGLYYSRVVAWQTAGPRRYPPVCIELKYNKFLEAVYKKI